MKCVRNHCLDKTNCSATSANSTSPTTSSSSTVVSSQANHFSLHNWITKGDLPIEDTSQWLRSVNISRLEELLKRNKQKIDSMDERGHTLLHLAILANRIEIVQLLINLGANVTLANRDGWSPLHIAAYSGHSDIISFLLQNKL